MGIIGQEQDAAGRGQHEEGADQRLLNLREAALGPGEEQGAGDSSRSRGQLHPEAREVKVHPIGRDDTQAGDLGHCQIDEDDASRQHLASHGHVGRQHEDPRQHGGAQNREVEAVEIHFVASSRRLTMSSNMAKRSVAPSVLPTQWGSTIGVRPDRSDSHFEGRSGW